MMLCQEISKFQNSAMVLLQIAAIIQNIVDVYVCKIVQTVL